MEEDPDRAGPMRCPTFDQAATFALMIMKAGWTGSKIGNPGKWDRYIGTFTLCLSMTTAIVPLVQPKYPHLSA